MSEDDSQSFAFLVKMDNVRNLATVLKAIHFKEMTTVVVTENGMKFIVEDAKCAQATAYIQAALFREYIFNEETVMFKINLTILLECLQIFGTSSSSPEHPPPAMRMCYTGQGSPLTILLEEGGVVTDCSILTLNSDEILDFEFNSENVISKIITKSEYLKEAFTDMDSSSEVVEFRVCSSDPQLRISTFGQAGNTHVDFPNTNDVMETFECKEPHTNRYRLTLLKPSVKALHQSSKVSLRTDTRGFVSLQYMIRTDGKICFVDYICAPQEDPDL